MTRQNKTTIHLKQPVIRERKKLTVHERESPEQINPTGRERGSHLEMKNLKIQELKHKKTSFKWKTYFSVTTKKGIVEVQISRLGNHMKKVSVPVAIRKLPIKTTLQYHDTGTRTAIDKDCPKY